MKASSAPGRARFYRTGIAALSAAALVFSAGCGALVGGGGSNGSGGGVNLTVALIPDPPGASQFYREQFNLFEKANPGIKVNVVENPAAQQLNAVELMFQQGKAPDVFRAQGDAALTRFYDRGWVAPLDKLVNAAFIARFPAGSLNPGTSGLHRNGKLVSIPLVWGDWSNTQLFLYNKDILAKNGFSGPPKTWSEMANMATTITKNGGGKVFGLAPGAGAASIGWFASAAAPAYASPGINMVTGKPQIASGNLVQLVEMWRKLQADHVLMPGWETWDLSRAFSEFAAGRLAMYPSGAWHVAEIRKLAPTIGLGITSLPVPDSGRVAYSPRASAHQPLWSMSSKSKHPAEALKLMDFLGSVPFYRAYYQKFGSFTASPAAWQDQAAKNPDQAAILQVAAETIKTTPNPALLDTGAKDFWYAINSKPELSWNDAMMNSIVNNKPFAPAAQKLDSAVEAFIAQSEAKTPGVRNALSFPTWNPMTDFTPSK
ncbi:MAG TPA: extracellular solute-binding protein [Streptosporangiaceae bacterium]|jgi:multiple sugar transport system substrate-binding protein|nr:extracellular solute-binding protein [Streptosporangiaceae bacterium]